MKQYDRIIVDRLLDSYERSRLYKGENKVSVNISLNMTKRGFPEYFDENSDAYLEIHAACEMLERDGISNIVWKDGHKGHILEKVVLNSENIKRAYEYVSRSDKKDICKREAEDVLRFSEGCMRPVTRDFSLFLISRLSDGRSVREYGDIYSRGDLSRLVRTIRAVEEFSGETYLREFSVALLGDSKAVEDMKGTIAKVFRRFGGAKFSDEGFEEILAEYGIYSTPNYVYFKGCGVFRFGKAAGTVDLGCMNQGVGISGEDMEDLCPVDLSMVRRVVTVENLTSFFSFSESGCLIIYLGGYHNRVRRRMLSIIYEHLPDVTYQHFGDIDAGGFEIFFDLRRKTGIDFRPYRMDADTLKKYSRFGRRLTANDGKRLGLLKEKVLRGEDGYGADEKSAREITECIDAMLEGDVKLEQECVAGI